LNPKVTSMPFQRLRGTTKKQEIGKPITETATLFREELNIKSPISPFVGRDFTRTTVYGDGIKDEEIYNIFDTERILNKPVVV